MSWIVEVVKNTAKTDEERKTETIRLLSFDNTNLHLPSARLEYPDNGFGSTSGLRPGDKVDTVLPAGKYNALIMLGGVIVASPPNAISEEAAQGRPLDDNAEKTADVHYWVLFSKKSKKAGTYHRGRSSL